MASTKRPRNPHSAKKPDGAPLTLKQIEDDQAATAAAEARWEGMDPLDILSVIVREGACAMADCVDRTKSMLADRSQEYSIQLASHLAWQIDKATRMIGELRKLDTHDRAMLARITPEERFAHVMLYLEMEMPAGHRDDVVALMDNLMSKGGVLG